MGSVRQDRGATVPATAFSTSLVGTPIGISVVNGKVSALARARPAEDGWYPLSAINQIRLSNGIITRIEAV
jgi:hypothetical protein